MKSKHYYLSLLLLVLLVSNLSAQTDTANKGFLSLNGENVSYYSNRQNLRLTKKMGWYSDNSNVVIDNQNSYQGQSSLFIRSILEKPTEAFFYLSNRDVVGKKVVFSGKYKYVQGDKAKVDFSIRVRTYYRTMIDEVVKKECDGDQDWTDFEVEMPLQRTEDFYFGIFASGDVKLWISDCKVMVDGQSFDVFVDPSREVNKDMEFMEGSKITLGSVNRQTLENLEVLGRVWGFLKYYHPQVSAGKYNWDFELFRVLPEIANATGKRERNKLLNKWIDKYGEITEVGDYVIADSSRYHRYARLDWLKDRDLFDKTLSDKLLKIKNAKRSSIFNYYLPPLSGKEEVEFRRDKPYPAISWEDQGYRILTIYRLWNAIEYAYPYISLMDHSWDSLLAKYLPEFVETPSEKELDRSIQKLAAELNDSHATLRFPPKQVPRKRGVPLQLAQTSDGKFAIKDTQLKEIDRGAVVLAVDDKPISEIIDSYRPIVPASNEWGLRRNISPFLFSTTEDEIKITVEFGGKVVDKKVPVGRATKPMVTGRKTVKDYHLESMDIVYINVGEISEERLDELMRTRMNAKGIILDMRRYPRGWYIKRIMEHYLYPRPTPFMWFSLNSKCHPGNFFLEMDGPVGFKENPNYYKGKVAIIVNEMTQSFGELIATAYSVSPNSAVIGRQTAGANGHVGYVFLPRGIKFTYTAGGAFYPDWGQQQRVGMKIDIPINLTVEDVEAGEDVWIKKAIEYINGK